VLDAYPITKERLSYFVVPDIAHESAFDAVLRSHPSVQYVIHTASPYHFNITDPVQDFIVPAVNGTTGILRSITAYAPNVKRVVITSSSAAILNPSNYAKVYDESIWGETSWEEALDPRKAYRASKVSFSFPLSILPEAIY
jgi:nucleoside-diphosphate-sugar epimerase